LVRNQEGRDVAALQNDYATIYHPAQRLHFRRDQPRAAADMIIENDIDGAPAVAACDTRSGAREILGS
jgi:hypothetical protein